MIDETGGSPFWDGLAGRFFGLTFQQADEFNAVNGHQFIADLMPKHPIYTAMLTEAARAAIGLPHPSGRAAMRMLEHEGFSWTRYCDIFDGGPTMTALTDHVRSIRDAAVGPLAAIVDDADEEVLVASGRLADYRCVCGLAERRDGRIALSAKTAAHLGVGIGDEVVVAARW
ncbi:hypothetical protein GCM10011380_20620 [Sphingomonas metalli]|uniref:Arginine N-succinyltransferase n=1 Tax=Sphingomonas metalli TaxID=1779358 RepID=A0A916WTE4_9SPHN|nr:hypothetical protein GCM10011380_20620 [Sphingomonas metalli]